MERIVLKGHKGAPGRAEGEALVGKESLSFYSDVDIRNGRFANPRHDLYGKAPADKILVFPIPKGGTGSAWRIPDLVNRGIGPKAIVNFKTNTIFAQGAIMANIPLVDRLDTDPTEVIESGDHVIVDGDAGTVEVIKKKRPV